MKLESPLEIRCVLRDSEEKLRSNLKLISDYATSLRIMFIDIGLNYVA